ncbi:hypothetical protein EVAR_2233_1 [Eumeta japonica]|uniref:Uncharacterized protein n=1 Tax=Eumeta variegata TaxID=151549 RepID=A0A4C1SHQ0_EUMVA|nr:hypothetical protein EVAR_2233_1 [Eumeta japonica]
MFNAYVAFTFVVDFVVIVAEALTNGSRRRASCGHVATRSVILKHGSNLGCWRFHMMYLDLLFVVDYSEKEISRILVGIAVVRRIGREVGKETKSWSRME